MHLAAVRLCYHAHLGTMRRLVAALCAALTAAYVYGAYRFYEQERLARREGASAGLTALPAPDAVYHPEAAIGLVRERLARFQFREPERLLIERSLVTTPAFYEPPFLLATFHANRLEHPEKVMAAYELAVERFPVNGRLRVAYGIWLLEARQDLSAWRLLGDPLERAEPQLRAAMDLEPALTSLALDALREAHVPPERWVELASEDALSRRHLIDALFRAGHLELGVEVAGESASDASLRRMAELALRADRPEIAVDAARRWLELTEAEQGPGTESFAPAITLFRAYLATGDEVEADRALAEVQARIESAHGGSSRVSIEFLALMGEEYSRAGRTLAAETLFGEALLRSPTYVPALIGLARAAARTGEAARAEAHYRQVLRLEPGHAAARDELASLMTRMERQRR